MYSIRSFGDMIMDPIRMDAYIRALQSAITPGCTVLDIGTGTGIFAILAHRMGAGRVIAIEPNDSIELARQIAAANGCPSTVEFHQTMSTDLKLENRVDVIVSDLRGLLPYFGQHIPSIIDARDRLLAPGGTLVPWRDEVWLSVIEDEGGYSHVIRPWRQNSYGIDMAAASRMVANQSTLLPSTWDQLLVEPKLAASLDYYKLADANFASELQMRIARDGTVHGICIWFDTELAPSIGFSNKPVHAGGNRPIYRNGFFPLSEPVQVAQGDEVVVNMHADLIGADYVWRWATRVTTPDGTVRAEFRQSSLAGAPLSLPGLLRRAAGHIATLNDEGLLDRAILARMDQGLPLGEIAHQVLAEFRGQLADWNEALARVGEISDRYGR